MHLFFDDHEMSLGYALFTTGNVFSSVIGAPLAAALLQLDGVLGLAGWQWLFLLEGIPAVVLGYVLWKRLARAPASAEFLSLQERTCSAAQCHTFCLCRSHYGGKPLSYITAFGSFLMIMVVDPI